MNISEIKNNNAGNFNSDNKKEEYSAGDTRNNKPSRSASDRMDDKRRSPLDILSSMCRKKAAELYSGAFPDIVEKRLEKELQYIANRGDAVQFVMASELSRKAREKNIPVFFRGKLEGSLVDFLADISFTNPLPPHYYCKKCNHVEFPIEYRRFRCGTDLPQKKCPHCGSLLKTDGFGIPFENVYYYEDGNDCLCLETIDEFFDECLSSEWRTADLIDDDYRDTYRKIDSAEDIIFRTVGCVDPDVKRRTIEYGDSINNDVRFTCVTNPALKFLYEMNKATGTNSRNALFSDSKTLAMFKGTDAIGVSVNDLGFPYGTLGVPIYGGERMLTVLHSATLNRFSDLIRVTGVILGEGTWLNNGDYLIREGIARFTDIISFSDRIIFTLMRHGMDGRRAASIAETVSNGRTMTPDMIREMEGREVSDWFIESMMEIKSLLPLSEVIIQNGISFKCAWYKAHFPTEFYNCFFRVFADDALFNEIKKGRNRVEDLMDEYDPAAMRDLGRPFFEQYPILMVAREMYSRNIMITG